MSKIPTAEEFVNQYDWENSTLDIPSVLREFAKLHVEAALEQASKVFDVNTDGDYLEHPTSERVIAAYPLSNIK